MLVPRSFLTLGWVKAVVWPVTLVALVSSGCRPKPLIPPTPQMDTAQRFWIRVLLLEGAAECSLQVRTGWTVAVDQAQTDSLYFQETTHPVGVRVTGGRLVIGEEALAAKQVTVLPEPPFIFTLNGRDYRGNAVFALKQDGLSLDVINLVPLEAYLAGVVGAEMPNYWEPEALKAQAIAARTYALYIKKRFGPGRSWDIRSTQANQLYLGVAAESPQVWRVVEETAAQVLVCLHSNGQEDLFPTYYSSICAGHTENSSNVFGDSFAPLAGVPCPYCQDIARISLFFWPMVRFDKSFVSSRILQKYPALNNLGAVVNITPGRQSDYPGFSRLTSAKLTGSSGGTGYLRAEDLRLTIDPSGTKMRSTCCQIGDFGNEWAFVAGRGYGHGVGLCQCGAQGMARNGSTAEQILAYYYPSSRLVTGY